MASEKPEPIEHLETSKALGDIDAFRDQVRASIIAATGIHPTIMGFDLGAPGGDEPIVAVRRPDGTLEILPPPKRTPT